MHRCVALVLFLLCHFLICGCSRNGETGLNPGDLPPSIELKDLEGNPQSLTSLKGKVVLVNFWATWCGPCIQELPALQELYLKLKDKGFVVLGVGADDPLSTFIQVQKKFSLTYPIVYDSKAAVNKSYKVQGYPESFLIGKDGRLVMLPDFESGMPAVRVVGPRNWSSAASIALINQLLEPS